MTAVYVAFFCTVFALAATLVVVAATMLSSKRSQQERAAGQDEGHDGMWWST